MSLKERLKSETKPLHDATEQAMESRRILADDYSLDEYQSHLKILWKAHRSVEDARLRFPNHTELATFEIAQVAEVLRSDLSTLNVDETGSFDQLDLSNGFQAIGALYVAQGSQLGRMYIANSKQAQFEKWHGVEPGYYSRSTEGKVNWKKFTEGLNHIPAEYHDDVVEGAVKAFEEFIRIAKAGA
ncbi:MAG: biliverdin-producing heme oxygenase [Flavobacteriia bacterium]|nr:biliverdin-producing heme oxygenase [Flavobacteriia bacterium]